MPRHIETFSECAGPGTARPHQELGGLAGFIISAWYVSGALTIIGGLAFIFGLIALAGPMGACILAGLILIALAEIKYWYYNERLLCIRDAECAIGTVISEPTAAFDGDRKLNLLLAPFTRIESRAVALAHVDRNRIMLSTPANFTDGFHGNGPPNIPDAMTLSTHPPALTNYLGKLAGVDPADSGDDSNMYNQTTIGIVDALLLPSNVGVDGLPKNFQGRFYRKDPAEITDPSTFAAIPQDYDSSVAWQSPDQKSALPLNPQFRFDIGHVVPYLHCEIEGNYVAILIDDFLVAVSAFLVFCLIPGLGPLIGLAAGFLAWLIKKIIDWASGNDGDAAEPDVDWDDPGFTGYPDVTESTNDVVVTHGNWIKDEEHHEYFEIHPVRAWYIVARLGPGEDPVDDTREHGEAGQNYDPAQLTSDVAERICDIVTRAEGEDSDEVVVVESRRALSFGMDTRYGGGGTAIR
jgi:hypothetical protein